MRVCHNVLIFLLIDIKCLCNVLLVEFCTNIFIFVSWTHMGEFLFIWCVHKVDCWYHLELLLYIKKKIFKSWPSFALSIYAFDLTVCLCAFDLIFHVCVCVYYRWGYYWDLVYLFLICTAPFPYFKFPQISGSFSDFILFHCATCLFLWPNYLILE